MSTLETNLIQPATGTALQVGASGDTITVPSGATIVNSGTATGFGDNTPAFSVYINSDQTLSDNTDTLADFDTETYDTDSVYNTTTKRFVAPADGKYFFYTRGRFLQVEISQYVISIRKNGSEIAKRYMYSGGAGTIMFSDIYYWSYDISCNVSLSADDYVDVYVKADNISGSTITFHGGTVHSEFSGYKIIT